jgi:nucleotide-binding universal stress UspA family protein
MKILIPISEDISSRAAIPVALDMVDGVGSEVVLASVGELPEVPEQAAEARDALNRRLAEARREITGVPVRTRVELAGDPVRGIIQIAREEHVDRIVIASHRRGAFQSLIERSVAEDLRDELARIPVTVVPVN